MAQPTETERRFEVSERTSALPVPALSRYARPDAKKAEAPAATGGDADAARAEDRADASVGDRVMASDTRDVPLEAAPEQIEDLLEVDSLRDVDSLPGADPRSREGAPPEHEPIVQAASEEWATDPSPPQPVADARRTDAHPGAPATNDERRDVPALRREQGPPPPEPKRPFWKRLSMARPAAATPPPVAQVPPDLLRPALERIDHLTRRFEHEQKSLHERIDQFEHNITRLWELEEQMGLEEVRAQLAVIQANQEEIADGVHAIARNVAVAAGLGLAVLGGVLLWVLL